MKNLNYPLSAHFSPKTYLAALFAFGIFLFSNCSKYDPPPRVLVFSKTSGYRHASIPDGVAALRKLCKENGIWLDSTENAADFTEQNLKKYATVIFLSTTGDVLDRDQEIAFERYIQAGGGFVGIHAATDTEYGWKWFGGLSGAYFQSHPKQQDATLKILDHNHLSTKCLPGDTWKRFDEWYNFKEINPAVNVLLTIDETSYTGGENSANHPMAWYHEYDGGRAFYTALGHTNESFREPLFLQHVLGGLIYAIGKNAPKKYNLCHSEMRPDPTRFVKTVLASDLTEPMEFDIFPNGKVLLIERRGALKLFNPNTEMLNVAAKMDVFNGEEDGLMGLAIDPNYSKNNWIYLYYSSPTESVNQLSRFIFRGDSLDRASEKVVLKVGTQRDECCHTGGSLCFSPEGFLFLSTGDNSNPFDSEGYAPIDQRPGRSPWDAQKSSANTNDLRGKILRIKVLDDGTYLCPAGNLFNENEKHITSVGPKTTEIGESRPEIYVMGCRNPFRISVDPRRKLLFWGEVGPDAGEPDTARGPQGHDEVNRARAAGNFGWPHFVGNNKPYRRHDFLTKKNGPFFDAANPQNLSPNNTGLKNLPPAQPAMIWYPYGTSSEFPMVGVGGRNAMAGPVYYCDEYPAATRFPKYVDGKLITYDWMRGWMMLASLDSLGNLANLELFGDSVKLSRPMDMFLDKNGSLWVLEYGTQWFASNPDARLSRIDFVRGNRPPVAGLAVSKTAGAAPLETQLSVSKSKDYDGDELKFEIDFGDGTPKLFIEKGKWTQAGRTRFVSKISKENAWPGGKSPAKTVALDSIFHVYKTSGNFEIRLKVTDAAGKFSTEKRKIFVGNEPPTVRWDFAGRNRSFYKTGTNLDYKIVVEDAEDGSLADGKIAPTDIAATIDYLESGFDISQIAQGHLAAMAATEYSRGKMLTEKSDCKTCHAADRAINGPSYQAVAERYRKNEFAVRTLTAKVIKGGAGNWGQTVMSAHPQLPETDVSEMVRWILTLGDPPRPVQKISLAGNYALAAPDGSGAKSNEKGKPKPPGTFIFKASYRDRGSRKQASLENGEVVALRPAFQQAESADSLSKGVTTYRTLAEGDTVVLRDLRHGSFFVFKRVDLAGLRGVSLGIGSGDKNTQIGGGRVEIRLGNAAGKLLGTAKLEGKNGVDMNFSEVNVPISEPSDGRFHNLFFVLKNENNASSQVATVDWVRFEF